jgi:hypothetical protein
MATIPTPPTPHRTWCDESECTTRKDGQLVHRSAGEAFDLSTTRVWTASMLTVQLVDTGEGIQVGVTVQGAVTASYRMTLTPQVAAEVGDALLDHVERALGLGRSSGA